MTKRSARRTGLALKAAATAAMGLMLGGCYYGDVNGSSYAYGYGEDCYARYGDSYWDYEPRYYDDGYGYDCYDRDDYRTGFVQIGFYGGWYNDFFYPGHGIYIFDRYGGRHSMGPQYLNYWGGRRAYWKHYRDRDWHRDRAGGSWSDGGRHDGRRGDGRWDRDRRDGDGRGAGAPRGDGTYNPASDGKGGWGGPGIRRTPRENWGDDPNAAATRDGRGGPRGERPAPPPTSTPPAPVIQEIPAPSPMPQGGRPGWGSGRDARRGDPSGVAAAPRGDGGGRHDRGGWSGESARAAPPAAPAPSAEWTPPARSAPRVDWTPPARTAPPVASSEPGPRAAPPPPPRADRAPRVDAPARRFETRGGDTPGDD